MGKLHQPPIFFNESILKVEECSLHDLIDVVLKFGRNLFFGISYSIASSPDSPSKFVVQNNRSFQRLLMVVHIFLLLFFLNKFNTENFISSPCSLVNLIKKGIYVVIFLGMIAGYRCLEVKGRKTNGGIAEIFSQCVVVQKTFNALGLHFPAKSKVKTLGRTICFGICLVCVIRQLVFTIQNEHWYLYFDEFFANTISFGFWTANETNSDNLRILLGTMGIITDGLLANYCYFVQTIHFTFEVTMWLVFYKLNSGLKDGVLTAKHLPEVVDLHFQSTQLLEQINELISPLTFVFIVFDITHLCFWANFVAVDLEIKPFYITALCVFVKTGVELILVSDVNSKAHKISEWLERCCSKPQNFPQMDIIKFTVFTSQIYSKESIGFKGLHFFVVTPNLAITIAGIVITYSVAANQFCKSN